MNYQAKDYSGLIGLPGFSEMLLKNHFALYQGYVNNTNKLMDLLTQIVKNGQINQPEFAELKRRLGWEWNGMRLHEYYFENLGGKETLSTGSRLYQKISESFGSYELWEKEFKAMGTMRGIGWVALYYDRPADRLINFWINEHDVGHPAGAELLLIMDVFEHAYITDYGLKKADYIEAFFKNINWKAVENRLKY
ncbi:MAG: superoxide dismutase [Candidatus Aminicenantes bacterium]|nr:superoxide dismutase [Candidatus Aminicenantes bacterium]